TSARDRILAAPCPVGNGPRLCLLTRKLRRQIGRRCRQPAPPQFRVSYFERDLPVLPPLARHDIEQLLVRQLRHVPAQVFKLNAHGSSVRPRSYFAIASET